jgi:hypothetical protein
MDTDERGYGRVEVERTILGELDWQGRRSRHKIVQSILKDLIYAQSGLRVVFEFEAAD